MFTKEEASLLKQRFWKAFGQYMALQLSAEGLKINWINYKTGIRYLNFKMDADNKQAYIQIHLSHPDFEIQEMMMEQFRNLEKMLQTYLPEPWKWELLRYDDYGNIYSSIGIAISGVNVFRETDWPTLISFFKLRMIALDAFWCDAKFGFEMFE